MIIGGAIGDALGMAVETWSPEKILEVYPQGIKRFIPPTNHKWFDPEKTPAGSTTDDTQLTLATMRGFVIGQNQNKANSELDFADHYMKGIAEAHCDAMKKTTDGWGHTTRDAIRRLSNGVHWTLSGKTTEANRGTGNGVPMKCSPLAAWYVSSIGKSLIEFFDFDKFCVDYSAMTHYSKMSAKACYCHVNAVHVCLINTPSIFNPSDFAQIVSQCAEELNNDVSHLNDAPDRLETRMMDLIRLCDDLPSMSQEQIITEFGNGSCYVYDSLPFSYAWFLKNPFSFQILEQVVMAGGDTDTNAKMVGEMLGALHGFDAIQTYMPWAMEELIDSDEILSVTDQFCDAFGIN